MCACTVRHDRPRCNDAACDATLIRRDTDQEAGAVQQTNGFDRERKPAHVRDATEIPHVLESSCRRDRGRRQDGPFSAPPFATTRPATDAYDLVDGDALHAAMIDRTVAQHAGTAEDGRGEHVMVSDRARDAVVGRAEDSHDRTSQGRGQMHRPGIVGDHRGRQTRQAPRRAPETRCAQSGSPPARPPSGAFARNQDSIARPASRSCPAPTSRQVALWFRMRRPATSATRSGSHCLAWP